MAEEASVPSISPATPPFKPKRPPTNSFCFASIPVADSSRAQSFYKAVFTWTFWTPPGASVTVFHTGGEIMGSFSTRAKDYAPAAGGITLYTMVEDVDLTLQKIVEAGGTVEKDKFIEGGHTEMALYRDTEGNLGGILHWLI